MTQPSDFARPFDAKDVQHFEGRGGRIYDYVEDESVMDRLDEGFGVTGWSVEVEPIPVYEGVVKVTLRAGGAVYQDFGYPSNGTGGEALKEAVSDGIRRCGRYLGIARDLYRKHSTSQAAAYSSPAVGGPATGRVSPRPVASTVPPEPEDIADTFGIIHGGAATDDGTCPRHNKPWRENSRGFYCSSKNDDGSWCDEKPTQRWISARGAVAAR